MTALSRIQCCLAMIALLAAADSSHAADPFELQVEARLDKQNYCAGEPITLKVSFSNPTASKFSQSAYFTADGRILDDNGDIELALSATLVGPNGYAEEWRQRFHRNPWLLDYCTAGVVFPPNKRTVRPVVLTRVMRPTEPGEYSLRWSIHLPFHAEGEDPEGKDPEKFTHWADGHGKLRFRLLARDDAALKRRAAELLRASKKTHRAGELPLRQLATMPPPVAMPAFRQYVKDKPKGWSAGFYLSYALRELIYVDSEDAVELIGDFLESSLTSNHGIPKLHSADRSGDIWLFCGSRDALADMYHTTRSARIRRKIYSTYGRGGIFPPHSNIDEQRGRGKQRPDST